MRVLVCGGRHFHNRAFAESYLDKLHAIYKFDCVIHGAARGGDTLAAQWASTHAIPVEAFPADWDKLGRAAGVLRNKQMIAQGQPDMVVALPGGRGTHHMRLQASQAGLLVIDLDVERVRKMVEKAYGALK